MRNESDFVNKYRNASDDLGFAARALERKNRFLQSVEAFAIKMRDRNAMAPGETDNAEKAFGMVVEKIQQFRRKFGYYFSE